MDAMRGETLKPRRLSDLDGVTRETRLAGPRELDDPRCVKAHPVTIGVRGLEDLWSILLTVISDILVCLHHGELGVRVPYASVAPQSRWMPLVIQQEWAATLT
jgi:hypothetical protein